jgi:protein-tyrosine phosphatase
VTEIELDGTVNTRDVGGLPLADGSGRIRDDVLLRSDNLQDLSDSDVRRLVDEWHVKRVVDLRTGVELRGTGPGRLDGIEGVRVDHLSLFPEVGDTTDSAAAEEMEDDVLPWARKPGQRRHEEPVDEVRDWSPNPVARVYLRYLVQRPDSIVAALRDIADAADDGGATVVHCAAGKDRTGVVVALALDLVGVGRDAIEADYLATVPHAQQILERLLSSPVYFDDVNGTDAADHAPRAGTMPALLDGIEEHFGGTAKFLAAGGWTDEDTAKLRRALVV